MKFFLHVILVAIVFSCIENHEISKVDLALKKIKSGKGNESDINDLLENLPNQDGTYYIKVPRANFKIVFPVCNVKFIKNKQIIDNKTIEIFCHRANMQNKNHINLAYQIDYVYLPEIKTNQQIENLFDSQREYLLSATNSELEFENNIDYQGVYGRYLYFSVDNSNIKTSCKMFYKNGVFYKLVVLTEHGKFLNKKISQFFDSFQIL
jgi:hypothetical protein